MKGLFQIVLFFTLVFIPAYTLAQSMSERRVYYLDATYSMVSPEKLWDPVRKDLEKAINEIQDETTEIYVVAFGGDRGNALELWSDFATESGKKKIISKFMSYTPQKNTMTYLDRPLSNFYNTHVDSGKITYCFLMTDGQDENADRNLFPALLRQWGTKCGNKEVYGFYVALNDAAVDSSIKNIISTQDHLWLVKSADVNINTIRLAKEVVCNVRGDNSIEIPIYDGNLSRVRVSTALIGSGASGISLGNCEVKGGTLSIDFNVTSDISTMPDVQQCGINLTLQNAEDFDILLTEEVKVTFNNKKEKVLKTPTGKVKMGEVIQYDKFLCNPRSVKPLKYQMIFDMSPDAKADINSYAELDIVYNDDTPVNLEDMLVVVNGDTLRNNKIIVKPSCLTADIEISFSSDAQKGKHQGYLRLGKHNIDRVNSTVLGDSSVVDVCQWTIRNNKRMNPLLVSILWILALIIVTLLLWFIIFRNIFFPKFGSIRKTFTIPNAAPLIVKFKGARQVVISAQSNKRQSLWNRIWTGKIIYLTHPAFPTPILFKPARKGHILAITQNNYVITPNPIPGIGPSATITDIVGNQKIVVN